MNYFLVKNDDDDDDDDNNNNNNNNNNENDGIALNILRSNESDDYHHENVPSVGLASNKVEKLLLQYGLNELSEKKKPLWLIGIEQLWAPMPVMIWIAAITEGIIKNWPDMIILLVIQFINASLGFYEIVKAGDAVSALKKSLKPLATVKRDGNWKNINAKELVPGDLVLLAAGSSIPADCFVNEGSIEVDQSALTGESLPVTMYKDSSCKMGSNVVRGEVEGTVEFTGANTFFGKTASMLQSDSELGNLDKVLLDTMKVLVILSFGLSGIVFFYLIDQGTILEEAISFTVVLIVASIPIAIEIVCTTTLALGSKELAQRGKYFYIYLSNI
jgi:H+-transporting ATPase